MLTKKLPQNSLTILFIIAIFTLSSCNDKKNTVTAPEIDIIEEQEMDRSEKPMGTISVDTAKVWEKAYCDSSFDETARKKLDYLPNREFYVSLDRMKQYIRYFEKEAKQQNYEDLGLRIYLGIRPPKEGEEMSKETIFIAPTAVKTPNNNTREYTTTDVDSIDNIYSIEALNFFGSRNPPKAY